MRTKLARQDPGHDIKLRNDELEILRGKTGSGQGGFGRNSVFKGQEVVTRQRTLNPKFLA